MTVQKPQVLVPLCAAALGMTMAGAARADCGPVIAAFEKADATGRFAWFEVVDVNQAPTGDPIMVSIGDDSYVPVGGGAKFKGKSPVNRSLEGSAERFAQASRAQWRS